MLSILRLENMIMVNKHLEECKQCRKRLLFYNLKKYILDYINGKDYFNKRQNEGIHTRN